MFLKTKVIYKDTGADLGGRGGRPSFLRDLTLCRPKGSPLCNILRYPFSVTDPKVFLKAPIYTNFERGARADFLVKIFQKLPKNAFYGPFFQNFACGAENLAKMGSLE